MSKRGGEEVVGFIFPTKMAARMALTFGRQLYAMVLVTRRGRLLHSDVFPYYGSKPGEREPELNYAPVADAALKLELSSDSLRDDSRPRRIGERNES